ncbi:MAG: hypothetical protein IH974_03620 [Myxococcales bacterium]|nr:hypothetical protein [Myxococcales bacterium]
MRFWILTAITLMLAGDAIADTQLIGANTSDIRRIRIIDDFPSLHMEMSLIPELPTSNQVGPFIVTTDLIVNAQLRVNLVNPFSENPDTDCGAANNCHDLDRNLWIYVLSLKVGRDRPRDVLVLQPEHNAFNDFNGTFSTKAYLADDRRGNEDDTKGYPWGQRVMTEEVVIELRRQTIDGKTDPPGFKLEGFFPANN